MYVYACMYVRIYVYVCTRMNFNLLYVLRAGARHLRGEPPRRVSSDSLKTFLRQLLVVVMS